MLNLGYLCIKFSEFVLLFLVLYIKQKFGAENFLKYRDYIENTNLRILKIHNDYELNIYTDDLSTNDYCPII